MDRQIVWPGALPLETDILNTNRNAMVASGRLAMDILGTGTLVSGLACTPGAGMTVTIGAGAIYSLQNIDNTAYSSLPANIIDQVMKQGVLLGSNSPTFAISPPTTASQSVIYLIEVAFTEVDAGLTTLAFYNSANTSQPFSGPNNTGAQSYTTRTNGVNLVAKPGIAAASPTAPAVDTGFIPLYYVTVMYGQTTIIPANIVVAVGAPFLTALTQVGGNFNGRTLITTSTNLGISQAGGLFEIDTPGITVTLPSALGNLGKVFVIYSATSGSATLAAGNFNSAYGISTSTITLPAGGSVYLACDGTSWNAVGGSGSMGAPVKPQNAAGIGQWVAPVISGTTITLPTGGTWAYWWSNSGAGGAGVAAGGTAVFTGTLSNAFGFCWRIA